VPISSIACVDTLESKFCPDGEPDNGDWGDIEDPRPRIHARYTKALASKLSTLTPAAPRTLRGKLEYSTSTSANTTAGVHEQRERSKSNVATSSGKSAAGTSGGNASTTSQKKGAKATKGGDKSAAAAPTGGKKRKRGRPRKDEAPGTFQTPPRAPLVPLQLNPTSVRSRQGREAGVMWEGKRKQWNAMVETFREQGRQQVRAAAGDEFETPK
jgi:hypothetical protein